MNCVMITFKVYLGVILERKMQVMEHDIEWATRSFSEVNNNAYCEAIDKDGQVVATHGVKPQ